MDQALARGMEERVQGILAAGQRDSGGDLEFPGGQGVGWEVKRLGILGRGNPDGTCPALLFWGGQRRATLQA